MLCIAPLPLLIQCPTQQQRSSDPHPHPATTRWINNRQTSMQWWGLATREAKGAKTTESERKISSPNESRSICTTTFRGIFVGGTSISLRLSAEGIFFRRPPQPTTADDGMENAIFSRFFPFTNEGEHTYQKAINLNFAAFVLTSHQVGRHPIGLGRRDPIDKGRSNKWENER